MKTTKMLLLLIFTLTNSNILAQDTIHFLDGKEVKAKVKKVTSSNVEYVKYDNQNGPVYEIETDKLFKIAFENGSVEMFYTPNNGNSTIQQSTQTTTTVHGNNKTKNSEVKIETGDIIKFSIDTSSTNKNNSSTQSGKVEGNKSQQTSNVQNTSVNSSDPCYTDKTGDATFINKTQYPLTVFLFNSYGESLKTIDVPLNDSSMIYVMNEGVYKYSFHNSNSGEISPTTKRVIPYFEVYGEFYLKKCVPNTVLLKK